MRIVLSGSSGFLGKHLVRALSVAHDVIPFDRSSGLDMVNRADVEQVLESADLVIHTAATGVGRQNVSETETAVSYDAQGAKNFSEAASSRNIPLIYTSSIRVYGTEDELRSGEYSDVHPTSAYGRMKLRSEEIIHEIAREKGLRFTILRFAAIFGPYMSETAVVSLFLRAAMIGKPITFQGRGDNKRNFLYIDDAIRAVTLLIEHAQQASNKTFNIMHSETVTLRELVGRIGIIVGRDMPFEMGNREDDLSEADISIAKAREAFGWEPLIFLDEGLRRLHEFYMKENK